MTKIVCISDTHRQCPMDLPKGDILIHAGDFDIRDEFELNHTINWFIAVDFKTIVFIGGNHDIYLEQLFKVGIMPKMPNNVHYLMNNSIVVNNIKIWGSPFSPQFGNWAFMGHLEELNKIWQTIPEDTDIVITHCPPFGINDQARGISQGCPSLRNKIKEIKPKLHCHAHIHEGYGVYQDEHTTYINASLMDEFYNMINKPVEIEYDENNLP